MSETATENTNVYTPEFIVSEESEQYGAPQKYTGDVVLAYPDGTTIPYNRLIAEVHAIIEMSAQPRAYSLLVSSEEEARDLRARLTAAAEAKGVNVRGVLIDADAGVIEIALYEDSDIVIEW